MSLLPSSCDLELTPGQFCNREPVTHLALGTATPEMWGEPAPAGTDACLAGFCSAAHAAAEPSPTLAAAKATSAHVGNLTDDREILDAWRRLTDSYPEPIELRDLA